jgi:aspartate oxidase
VGITAPFQRIRADFAVVGAGVAGLRAAIDLAAARRLVEESPATIEQLTAWGTAFDREGSGLLFAREGAHSRNRVLHAHGDSTGSEIAVTLRQPARSLPGVAFQSFAAVTDLLIRDSEVVGVSALDEMTGSTVLIEARAILPAREESRGGLYRSDFPDKSPAFEKHSVITAVNGGDARVTFA